MDENILDGAAGFWFQIPQMMPRGWKSVVV